MARTIVGVLRGGTSSEYNLSLKTGAAMMAALSPDRYEIRDIFIDKAGVWHVRGTPSTPIRALQQIDVALVGLHGGNGEDGTVQRILQRAGVPYAGSTPLSSGLALNKTRAREILTRAGIRMPRAVAFFLNDPSNTVQMAQKVFAQFAPPYVIKPPSEGASHGIVVAATLKELPDALAGVLDRYGAALAEEYIRGRHASVGTIESFRGQELYALPPALVMLPDGHSMILPAHHEEGNLRHLVPSDFSHDEKMTLIKAARGAHRALGLSHFSRSDFIVTPRAAYLLEVNTIPGLYQGASFPPMLESVGSSVREFLEHSIQLARRNI